MKSSEIQKIRQVLRQDILNEFVVNPRFGGFAVLACKVGRQVRTHLSPNEAHSTAFLVQHEDFNVT